MTDADDFFRVKAEELGYLDDPKKEPREPGLGRGLWAFYRDSDIHPPEYIERVIPKHEMTGLLDERALAPVDRRSSRTVAGVG